MRCAAVALVLTLLLPAVPVTGGRPSVAAPAPLDLFGGGDRPAAGTPPALVAEVYYNALRADEYVVVANLEPALLDVSGWSLTDGEGTLTFPASSVIAANARITVAQNSTAYFEDTLRTAEFRYGGGAAPAMISSGTFQLNNAGDEVILRDLGGSIVDVFAYDASPYAGPGWTGPTALPVGQGNVARRDRDGVWRDTNTSVDWDLVRVWSLGQSEFASAEFTFTGTARAFVTPDARVRPLLDLLSGAATSIDLCLYTFTNAALFNPLADAISRGVRVRILLEGAPVGGIDRDEWSLVQLLGGTTAEIHFLVDNTSLDIQERYRFVHAKYAIVDGRTVLVSTENLGPSAFPTWNATGSRGWAVAVDHGPLAAYFTQAFEEDFDAARRDVYTLAEMAVMPVVPLSDPVGPRNVTFPPVTVTGRFLVIPVLGPDTSLSGETILGVLRNATESIHVEMFYAYTAWDAFPNLYLEKLLAAARRGVSVRLLLDASAYNVEDTDPIDNDDTVAYVNAVAASEGLDLQARLVDLDAHGLSRVHAKGLVVDGRWTLVSSINWNRNSPTANREAGLLIENADLAAYFDSVFAWDWNNDFAPPIADAGPGRTIRAGETVTFTGLGSSDDVGIVNWSWDFDEDGNDDAWGWTVAHRFDAPGRYTVRLRVADAGGSTDEDTAVVTVLSASPSTPPTWLWLVPLALAAIVGVVWFAVARRSRQRLSKPP